MWKSVGDLMSFLKRLSLNFKELNCKVNLLSKLFDTVCLWPLRATVTWLWYKMALYAWKTHNIALLKISSCCFRAKKNIKSFYIYVWLSGLHVCVTIFLSFILFSWIYTSLSKNWSHTLILQVESLPKFLFSTSQRCSTGLNSGFCPGQSMNENNASCSLKHSCTIWARWTLALFSWNYLSSDKNKFTDGISCSLRDLK